MASSSGAQFVTPPYLQAFRPASAMGSNKFDEGYSEDTRSQSGSDLPMRMDSRLGDSMTSDQYTQLPLPEWVLAMPEAERSEFAYAILRSLRTSSIAAIVEKLNPLLHLDPVVHLPPEITFQILSYLNPETLLRASTLSRAWRSRVMDSPLWKLLFRMEGWNSNFPAVRASEEAEKFKRAEVKERKTRARGPEDMDVEKPSFKKRLREKPLFGSGLSSDNTIRAKLAPLSLDNVRDGTSDSQEWAEQHSAVEADDSPIVRPEDRMEGITYPDDSTITPSMSEQLQRNSKSTQSDGNTLLSPTLSNTLDPPAVPSLFLPSSPEPKINWQYLYKQKRRLEDNWNSGKFSNFQLPHPDHPAEAHTECVYTIQYSGKYLVSGSRDKTVRIWDLDTQRLVRALKGHAASVLCLQFDERPHEDIVVSGGSDSHVILWRFSTGEMLKKLERAHGESVLSLRFDDRYLVTCSKDKTIRVWNRKELLPTDDAYPSSTTKSSARFPSYIINMQDQVENAGLRYKPLQPYSLLMTLEGHGAAVNAIQILDGQIVSASGDRNVKVWDVSTGACTRTFTGHTKGIACVQFDGRRIVSGSSDETVRIFDRATGAEVACLQGHSNLVRTVQAQFGDLPGNEEELEAEAKAVDRAFFAAKSKGQVSGQLTRAERRARNAGRRDPNSIFAYGAKLPPGGGGTKWARIVSGSYDETVIIWKKGPDGAWEKNKVLQRNEAVRAAGGRPRRPVPNQPNPSNAANQPQIQPGSGAAQTAAQAAAVQPNFHALAQQAQAQAQAAQNLAQQAQALHAASQAAQQGPPNTTTVATTTTTTHTTQDGNAVQLNSTIPAGTLQPPTHVPNTTTTTTAANAPAPAPPPAAVGGQSAHHHHHGLHHHHHPHAMNFPNQGINSRVFKLQFDARRIICCSQDPTIVGWDFANGDSDIVLASQFFDESV